MAVGDGVIGIHASAPRALPILVNGLEAPINATSHAVVRRGYAASRVVLPAAAAAGRQ